MNSIDFSQSQALLLALEVEQRMKANEAWILDFERNIQTLRSNYDLENNDYDSRERYPEKTFLEERYADWGKVLNGLSQKHQDLVDFSSKQHQTAAKLKWSLLDTATLAKLKFIHKAAGDKIDIFHSDLQSRISVLTNRLQEIQELTKNALTEINWIKNHPHKHLQQTLSRVTNGQEGSTYLTQWGDRLSRHLWNSGSLASDSTSSVEVPPPETEAQEPKNEYAF